MPVSTVPGPSSTKVVKPAGRARAGLAPADGAGELGDSRAGQSAAVRWPMASTLAIDRVVGVAEVDWSMALRSRSRAGPMNGVWNAPETGSGMPAWRRAPWRRRWPRRPPRRPGDDDLARRVEVGDPDVVVDAVAGALDEVVVEPEDGGHRALLGLGADLHGLATFVHQLHRVVEVERARRGECRILAKAVAGMGRASTPTRWTASKTTIDVRKVASCALRVSLSSSSSARKQERLEVSSRGLGASDDELPGRVVDPGLAHAGFLRSLAGIHEHDHLVGYYLSGGQRQTRICRTLIVVRWFHLVAHVTFGPAAVAHTARSSERSIRGERVPRRRSQLRFGALW